MGASRARTARPRCLGVLAARDVMFLALTPCPLPQKEKAEFGMEELKVVDGPGLY